MKKDGKVDKNTITEETYIYTFPLFKNIIQIIYIEHIL